MFIDRLIKKQAIYSVFTLLVATLIIFGSSYALFQASFADTNTQTMNIGELSVTFSNTSGGVLSNNDAINLTSMVPMSDVDATDVNRTDNKYAFIVRNNGTIAYSYTVKLTDNETYVSGGTNNLNGDITLLSHNYIRYKLNNEDNKTLGDQVNDIIYTYTINPGESHEFVLRLWVADPVVYNVPNEVLDTEVHLNIIIEGEAAETRAPKGWHNAREGTLLAGIKGNYSAPTATLTTPGQAASTSSEKVMAETPDDYGTSYYFRGAVDDNFVVFAGMCWRIVRVDGKGNIKLTLYNYNPNSLANPCAETGSSLAYARYSGSNTFASAFNASTSYNAYVGFMYGTPGSVKTGSMTDEDTYLVEHTVVDNTHKSTILSNLETWYDANLTSYESKLADVIWCNDKSLNTDSEFTPNTGYTNLGYNIEKTFYGATTRLLEDKATSWTKANTEKVTLKCPDAGSDGKLSKFTVSDIERGNGKLSKKIGLLTADEVAFAGICYGSSCSNSSYYLSQNASSYWWTLSPMSFAGSAAVLWYVRTYLSTASSRDRYAIRPAVALNSSVKYTLSNGAENAGKASNPFVISES